MENESMILKRNRVGDFSDQNSKRDAVRPFRPNQHFKEIKLNLNQFGTISDTKHKESINDQSINQNVKELTDES